MLSSWLCRPFLGSVRKRSIFSKEKLRTHHGDSKSLAKTAPLPRAAAFNANATTTRRLSFAAGSFALKQAAAVQRPAPAFSCTAVVAGEFKKVQLADYQGTRFLVNGTTRSADKSCIQREMGLPVLLPAGLVSRRVFEGRKSRAY